jgi:Asp-tRNA(Asn)/Glu-tRNA(Gln) amidotransferase B subunit
MDKVNSDPIATQGHIELAAELDPTLDRDVQVRIQQIQIEQVSRKDSCEFALAFAK